MTDKLHAVLFMMSIVLVITLIAGIGSGLFHDNDKCQPIINDHVDHSDDKTSVDCGHGPIDVISLPVNPPYGTVCVVKDLYSCSTGRILQAHSFTIKDKVLGPDLIGGGKVECTLATLGPGIWMTLEKSQKGMKWAPIISGPTGYALIPSTTGE